MIYLPNCAMSVISDHVEGQWHTGQKRITGHENGRTSKEIGEGL